MFHLCLCADSEEEDVQPEEAKPEEGETTETTEPTGEETQTTDTGILMCKKGKRFVEMHDKSKL